MKPFLQVRLNRGFLFAFKLPSYILWVFSPQTDSFLGICHSIFFSYEYVFVGTILTPCHVNLDKSGFLFLCNTSLNPAFGFSATFTLYFIHFRMINFSFVIFFYIFF